MQIVNVGDVEADEDRKVNSYAIKFDLEAIDKLQSTLAVLSSLPNQSGWKSPPKEVQILPFGYWARGVLC